MNIILLAATILVFVVPSYPTYPDAPISQPFGNMPEGATSPHTGIDISIPVGSAVFCDVDGWILEENDNARIYGRSLTILHPDGYVSLYAHLSAFKVNVGDFVRSGELIALSGGRPDDGIDGDGWSSGAHLHWEVRPIGHIDNSLYSINPFDYLALFDGTRYFLEEVSPGGYIAQ